MISSSFLSLIVCLIGLVALAVSANGKLEAVSLYMFSAGLLAFLLTWGGRVPR